MRRRICAGNWKMFKTTGETAAFIEAWQKCQATLPRSVTVVICPPFTALQTARDALGSASGTALGAQDMHWDIEGAFTGQISAPMLRDLGVEYVILGHSERRQHCAETDENVRRKTRAALDAGLTPIVAVGEPIAVREAGGACDYVTRQTHAALHGLDDAQIAQIVLAYEPIWAIGTGHNCDPNTANEVMGAMRDCLPALRDISILYGGSVKAENVAAYVAQEEIDGGLVGGASLDAQAFARLVSEAA